MEIGGMVRLGELYKIRSAGVKLEKALNLKILNEKFFPEPEKVMRDRIILPDKNMG